MAQGPSPLVKKWLQVKDGALAVNNEGQHQLSSLGSDKLNLVTVWGRARQGKSFLMNQLMGRPGFFQVRPGHIPCTVGADLSSFPSFTDFMAGHAAGKAVDRIGFVDVEGNGDKGPNYEALLAGPLLLMSKVVIMNWHGKMARDDMLRELSNVILVGRDLHKASGATFRGETGNVVCGHLHIVMRDTYNVAGVHDYLFEDEDTLGATGDVLDSIEVRNAIRLVIRKSFISYQVHGLPPPIINAMQLDGGKFDEDDVTEEFRQAIASFKLLLIEQLRYPCIYNGTALTGALIADQMIKFSTVQPSNEVLEALQAIGLVLGQKAVDIAVNYAIDYAIRYTFTAAVGYFCPPAAPVVGAATAAYTRNSAGRWINPKNGRFVAESIVKAAGLV